MSNKPRKFKLLFTPEARIVMEEFAKKVANHPAWIGTPLKKKKPTRRKMKKKK